MIPSRGDEELWYNKSTVHCTQHVPYVSCTIIILQLNPTMSNSVISKLLAISNRIGFPLDLPNPNLPLQMQKATSCWVFVNFRDQIITPRNLMPTSLSRTPTTSNYFSIPLRVRAGFYCITVTVSCGWNCILHAVTTDLLGIHYGSLIWLMKHSDHILNIILLWSGSWFASLNLFGCDVVETALHEGRVGRLMLTLSLLCSHSPNLGEHVYKVGKWELVV